MLFETNYYCCNNNKRWLNDKSIKPKLTIITMTRKRSLVEIRLKFIPIIEREIAAGILTIIKKTVTEGKTAAILVIKLNVKTIQSVFNKKLLKIP